MINRKMLFQRSSLLNFLPTRFYGAFLKNDDRKIELDVINPQLYIYVSVPNKDKI